MKGNEEFRMMCADHILLVVAKDIIEKINTIDVEGIKNLLMKKQLEQYEKITK